MSAVLNRIPEPHGEITIDLDPYMDEALNEVIETILLFGQYPQPNRRRPVQCKFDLIEHLTNDWNPSELAAFLLVALTNGDTFEAKMNAEKRLTEELSDKLRDSEIVRDKAFEMATEDE